MDIYKYINHLVQKAEKPSVPTGMTKEHHIDIIGQALQGYDPKTVLASIPTDREGIIRYDTQVMSRVACIAGIMLSHGYAKEWYKAFEAVMDTCAEAFTLKIRDIGTDFAVKEWMLAYNAAKHLIKPETQQRWESLIRSINPETLYTFVFLNRSLSN